MAKPPTVASLTWQEKLRFTASSGTQTLTLDGESAAGPSPVQTLAFSIAGCMAIDVVDILTKGRHPLKGLDVGFHGERATEPPHRFTGVRLAFTIRGEVPATAIERAIALSREKYCSVSNSLRGDITLTTEYEVVP